MTRFVTNLVPAAMRFAALTAQQGPAYAVATALTPLVAALLRGAQRSLRPERQSSMSKLISFRALAVVVLITLAASVAAEPATTAPAALRANLRLQRDPGAIHDPLPRLSGFAPTDLDDALATTGSAR